MMTEIVLKKCKKCGEEYPATSEFFFKTTHSKDGLRGSCKKCVSKQIKILNSQIVKAECSFIMNENCDKIYKIGVYEYNRNLKDNNGNYRCVKCAATMTHLNKSKKFNTDFNFFKEIDSELKAYLLGIIAGDGHISKNFQYLEVVANNKDLETLELFKKYLLPDNLIKNHPTSENCSKIIICSVSLCKDICRNLKIKSGKKSDKISLPDLDIYTRHFIRGLLDSDGWVKNIENGGGRSCFYSSTSTLILNQVKNYLCNFNIKTKIDGIKLVAFGDHASRFLSLIYDDAEFFLSRKKNRFNEWRK